MEKSEEKLTKETLQFYWQSVWRYPKSVIGLFITIPLTVLVYQFLPSLILATVLRRLAASDFQPHHIWASFGPSLIGYALLILFGGGIAWRVVDIIAWRLEANVERDIAQRVFLHLISQGANFHANHFGGSLVSQTNKLMGSYIRFADTTIFMVIPLASAIVCAVLLLAGRAPQFVLILLTFCVFYIVSSIFVTRKVRQLGARQAAAETKQTGYLADCVTNVMAIKSFATIKFERRQFQKATEQTHGKLLDLMRGTQRQQLYFSVVNNGISALSLTMAVIGVMVFKANVATVYLILNYTANITMQLWNFSNNALRNYNRSLGDAASMIAILQLQPEITDPVEPEKVRITKGAVDFNQVVFTHDGSDGALFHNMALAIQAGEKIGLVGHSGSGKTTLTRLLLRFSDLDAGEITIDGQNIARITQDDLRAHIAYVPQEPLLFHRTIRENIAYGKPGASQAEIEAAAHKAYAHEFIETLPQGYDTLVGERGVKLSGGQRQRIVIARAILKDAPILVLDEATSALDSESEKLIQAALWELMKGRTAIVIAHRLSTIQKMDRIIVLDHGEIIEQGSHAGLLKHGGTYAKLWAHQSGGFIEE
ncbi:MAG TPA: ABC transporter ATP-binding protein [Candidatus Saccharimonadales bacterium]|nr:ABC transporter ATP-binding protein [Candidatus Saccharimonadales bacterium]